MKSMTGFGRCETETSFGKLVVEIQSVNRKYFELNLSLPKEFSRFETDIRKKVSEQVQRGLVWVRVYLFPVGKAVENLLPDVKLLKSLQKGWEKIADELGYGKKAIDLSFLVRNTADLPHRATADAIEFDPLSECLDTALKALASMKTKEGTNLAKDIKARLTWLESKLEEIKHAAPDATEKMRLKLKERMEEMFVRSEALDERLLREVAIFAERVDITEELIRFHSHLGQYRALLADSKKEGTTGRKMDFLVQEMGREINTIGSKSMDAKISHLVVDVKAELEKIREQIQNIE